MPSLSIKVRVMFGRLDAFMARCHEVLQITTTSFQYTKLETITIPGIKGRELTDSCKRLHAEFVAALTKLRETEMDVLALRDGRYGGAVRVWTATMAQFDHRSVLLLI